MLDCVVKSIAILRLCVIYEIHVRKKSGDISCNQLFVILNVMHLGSHT